MQRHAHEWPILVENHWPNHGRKLTPSTLGRISNLQPSGPQPQYARGQRTCSIPPTVEYCQARRSCAALPLNGSGHSDTGTQTLSDRGICTPVC
jgi:hypothetical protein